MDGTIDIGTLSRRRFIVTGLTATGGLAIGLAFPSLAHAAARVAAQPWSTEKPAPHELDAWIAIEPDDSVLIRYGRSEMGQGSMTALPMIVAEELQCDWAKVRTEYASANRGLRENHVYGKDMSSVGSHSVRDAREDLQKIGAAARVRLIIAAAERWHVPVEQCHALSGKVIHQASGRSLRYGELVTAAAKITLQEEPAIKTPEQYTLLGKPMNRLDVPLKINGTAKFALDTRLPDMLYAAVAACPVFGGTLKSVDDTPLKGQRGVVQAVKLANAVVVVADRFWRAKQALALLKPEWEIGAAGKTDSAIFAKEYRDALDQPMVTARNDGNADAALATAAKTIDAVYEVPYLAHATMEPMNATAHLQTDRLDVWVGTQAADRTLQLAARISGLKPENVYIHNCFIGGGFGRKSMNDEMVQAIAVSKALGGKPVKLVWTREEDMTHDRYRPQAALRLKAGLGADGMPVAWHMQTAVGSLLRSLGVNKVESGIEPFAVEGLANNPYAIANTKVECLLKNTHVPVMFWRSVGSSQNAFVIESFVDEMAHAGGQDPYKFRRALLQARPDWIGVLDLVAEKGDWGKPLPSGTGRGIAIHECFGTVVGEVAEVSVSAKGEVKVERVTIAVDCGHAANPQTVAEQMEGGMVYGLSAALFGKITIKDGKVDQANFDTYRLVRLAQAPKTAVHFALSGGKKWGGCGEPGTAPIAAAVANAIFAVTGKRIRSLPIMDQDLSGSA